MEFLIQRFIQYIKHAGIKYTSDKTYKGYILRLYNLPPKMDTDLIHATYDEEYPKKVCTPYEEGKDRWLEISVTQSNFGNVLNTLSAIMERHIRNRGPRYPYS